MFNPENIACLTVFLQILTVLDPTKNLYIYYYIKLNCVDLAVYMEEIRTYNVLLRPVHTEDIYTQGDERCILSRKITQDFLQKLQFCI